MGFVFVLNRDEEISERMMIKLNLTYGMNLFPHFDESNEKSHEKIRFTVRFTVVILVEW